MLRTSTQSSKTALSIGLAALLLWTLACGVSTGGGSSSTSGGTEIPANSYVYVMQDDAIPPHLPLNGSVAQLHIENDGTLTQLSPATVVLGMIPTCFAADPSGTYLVIAGQGAINEFTIGTDGTLALNSAATVVPSGLPQVLGFTPNGAFLLVADSLNTLSSYSLSASGALTLVNTAVTGNYPEFLAVDPSAKFVYVTSTADNVISEYTISANGTLTSVGSISAGGQNAYGLAISPKKFVYSSTGLPPMITEFSINASTGALSVAGTFSGGTNFDIPAKLTFDPSGSNAYMYNAAGIAQFTVDTSTGALNLTGTEVTTAGPIVIDPSGKFAFGFTDYDTVGQFSIGSHGTLTPNGSIALDPNFDAQSLVIGQ